ncbi:PREDICTED: uncharacterized protein LOC104708863 [Camelina sativa]|uniref:Uncharacterized protein LOC104708863 n=1 Tax=Camelina sativa TaxID=90675 RepID=A0ABM0TBQ2_CAMSA|nr:PREDICTED: uncharacterized protein LOC104708863 [Camelina sativa]
MSSSSVVVGTADATSLLNINMSNVTKLTSTNYLVWKRQVYALCKGYDLAGYLDGSVAVPPTTLTTNDVSSANPAYKNWFDQLALLESPLPQEDQIDYILGVPEEYKSVVDQIEGLDTTQSFTVVLEKLINHE